MAIWDITVPAATNWTPSGSVPVDVVTGLTPPSDFDGATINSVTIVNGTGALVTNNGPTDDSAVMHWWVTNTADTSTYGDNSPSVAICDGAIGANVGTAQDIAGNGASISPAPTTAVSADWDKVRRNGTYTADMKDDGETFDNSAFTIRVDYTPSAPSDNLLADDVEAASEVSSPVIGQTHAIGGVTATEATVELSSPALGQVHAITADDVEIASETSTPAMLVVTPILAEDVEVASELSVPSLGQVHALATTDQELASELTSPALGQVHDLLADDTEVASELTSPAVGESHILVSTDVESASEVTSPVIGQTHNITADDVEVADEVTVPAIGQAHVLTANDTESASELSSPQVGQVHALTVTHIEATVELTTPALTEVAGSGDNLLAEDVEAAVELSTPSLAQVHVLQSVSVEAGSELTTPGLGNPLDIAKVFTPVRYMEVPTLEEKAVSRDVPTPEDLRLAELGFTAYTGEIWTNDANDVPFRLGGLYWQADAQRPSIRSRSGGWQQINDGKDGTSLPTEDPHRDGAFWNDNGVLKVSDG